MYLFSFFFPYIYFNVLFVIMILLKQLNILRIFILCIGNWRYLIVIIYFNWEIDKSFRRALTSNVGVVSPNERDLRKGHGEWHILLLSLKFSWSNESLLVELSLFSQALRASFLNLMLIRCFSFVDYPCFYILILTDTFISFVIKIDVSCLLKWTNITQESSYCLLIRMWR